MEPLTDTASAGEGRFALITDDMVDHLRRLIGVKITDTVEPWCYEASRDAVRHYAHGIGDDNPLWCDPGYGADSSAGSALAPPSFVFPLSRIISGYVGGLPGVHAMWAGSNLEWREPIRLGTPIATEAWLSDLTFHDTRFVGRAVQQSYHVDFYDAGTGALLAGGESWCFRTERDTARELGTKYVARSEQEPKRWTAEELADVAARYQAEERRGAEPRWWEEVAEGDAVDPRLKGPMTVTGFIAFAQGWGGLYIRANRLAAQQLRKHPGLGIPDRFNIPDVPERVHWDPDLARLVGTPDAYDYGPERASWLMHHLTDWMGDDGRLVSHRCQIRRHNPVGDLLEITGTVTERWRDDTGAYVRITQQAHQQDGELSVHGEGVVRLPERGEPS